MAAGLGFKTFTTGEVLTAADVNGYLMQGVLVFASAAARDAAITSPQEGQFAYLKDTNVTTYYTGSAWANVDTTGMTNPMTTTGDIIYSSSGSTPARLGIGTAGQVLKVNSGATAPEWAAPDLVLISETSFTSVASQAFDTQFTSTYTNYLAFITGTCTSSDTYTLQMRASGSTNTTSNYNQQRVVFNNTTVTASRQLSATSWGIGLAGNSVFGIEIQFQDPEVARNTYYNCRFNGSADMTYTSGRFAANTQFDGFIITASAGNITGVCSIYGVK